MSPTRRSGHFSTGITGNLSPEGRVQSLNLVSTLAYNSNVAPIQVRTVFGPSVAHRFSEALG